VAYTREDAKKAISQARSAKAQYSTTLAEAQLEALATISEQLEDLNKALGKHGAVGELARQLDGLSGALRRRG
jgi:putative lipoic acid-binding regulatory protein